MGQGETLPPRAPRSKNWPIEAARPVQVVATSQGTSCMVSWTAAVQQHPQPTCPQDAEAFDVIPEMMT
jgi:hypothetical protein